MRSRFYAERWDEGQRRRKPDQPDRAIPQDWYDETDGETGDKMGSEKRAEKRGDERRNEPRDADRPPSQKPTPPRKAIPVKTASVTPPTRAVTEPRETATPAVPERREPPPLKSPAPETQAAVTEARDALNELRAQMAAEAPNELASIQNAPKQNTPTESALKESVTKESTVSETAQNESAPGDKAPIPPAVEVGGEPLIRIEIPPHDEGSHVAVLTLNTPKIRNALTAEMRMALRGALKALAAEDRIHAVVITGADGNFCAGGDVRTMGETDPHKIRQRMTEVAETAEALASFPKPVIAAVAGHAAGAGVSLACLADIIVVDESAQFTFSFLRLALGPDWGLSWSLPRRVGATKARGLILSRGTIDAREAQQIGLADHFASEGETRYAAVELARQLCNGPREATAAVKTMLNDLVGLRQALADEMAMQLERFPSWEHQEGAKAFKEKRPADYTRKP